jgi:sulfur carrier protein ThiS
VKLHIGGHLTWFLPEKKSDLEVALDGPTRLTDILAKLGIPAGEIVLVVVNGELAELAACEVTNEERVEIYPPIGGGATQIT